MKPARMLRVMACAVLACLIAIPAASQSPAPHFEQGRAHTGLIVDGRPYLALAVQANNSSNYPAMLDAVWPMMERLHANTLLMPVAWEQIEPAEGEFDLSFLDTLIEEARTRDKRLVLLWYGAFKNTAPGYAPVWVKRDGERFPRMRTADGTAHYALSPHGAATREGDARAFAAVMRRLAKIDSQHTVIMVQVENETGSYGLARDHAPGPDGLFARPIPAELARGMGIARAPWAEAFGPRAEQFFMSWHMARYVEAVASAGLAEWDLPVMVNAALGDAFTAEAGDVGPSGGPNWNALPIWRIAAPSIDAYGPDIYTRDADAVMAFLGRFGADGAPLVVPETGNAAEYARFFWPALGRGTVLYSPFGMDRASPPNYPLGAKVLDEATLDSFAAPYALLAPVARHWARLAMDHATWGTARGNDAADQSHSMGRWRITAQYARWPFGEDNWTWIARDPHPLADVPTGGAVAMQLEPDTFLIAGRNVRLRIALTDPSEGEKAQLIEAQEGTFVKGESVMRRRWNGDQVDYGFNFGQQPVWLRVQMGTYR
ncbi:beta-galactosidase [Aurantiacibacter spongiae]|uniref:Beta-galactosidase n=1 Tax=Aurantiacibacter spongiae TaxID=2488860 RepID=A0A3N5CX53_9SPHN|nr:beta-galactosidase [Aurantiacibacter spongiae]